MQTSTFNNSYCPIVLAHSTIRIAPLCWHIQQDVFPQCVGTFNNSYFPTVLAHSTIRISPLCWHIQQDVLPHCVSTFNKTYCPTVLAHSTIYIAPLCWQCLSRLWWWSSSPSSLSSSSTWSSCSVSTRSSVVNRAPICSSITRNSTWWAVCSQQGLSQVWCILQSDSY